MLRVAEEAVELAQGDPRRAIELATSALAGAPGDREVVVVAHRGLGLAARQLGDLDSAEGHLRTAVRLADRAGLPRRAGEARLSLALVLSYLGRARAAMRALDRAATALRGHDRARLEMQRALLLQRMGRTDEALEGYKRARTGLRRHGDRLWEARLLTNRGLLRAYRGNLAGAAHDHQAARQLALDLGQPLMVALIEHNLGFITGRAGNVPEALTWFDRAEAAYVALGAPMAVLLADRAELLAASNLTAEAEASAQAAVDENVRSGNVVEQAEARLLLARTKLAAGAAGEARRVARAAQAQFRAQGRSSWALLAASVAFEAAMASSGFVVAGGRLDAVPLSPVAVSGKRGVRPPLRLVDEARRLAGELAAAGWEVEAAATRIIGGRLALARGESEAARADLAAARGSQRRQRPVVQRAQERYAAALLCLVDGDVAAALRHLRGGLRLLDQHRASLGATELRALTGSLGVELAGLGLSLAVERGRPADILSWSERWRAGALRLAPVRPPPDPVLAGLLAELRQVVAEAYEAATQSRDVGRCLARRAALEQAIRHHTRKATGRTEIAPRAAGRVDHDALAGHVLVEYAVVASVLLGVVMARRRTTVHALGPAREVVAEADAVRFALRRLARGAKGPAEGACRAVLDAGGRLLDQVLMAPLAQRVGGDAPLVVVPTGPLHGIPWATLPSLAGRAVSVAPSAAAWSDASGGPLPRPPRRVVGAAGPGLAAAAAELDALARRYPDAQVLTGPDATVANLLTGLDGADLGHVASHGELRADSPLFSSLSLADGPLTAYDLEGLRRPPPLLVLSSCDAGASDVRPGDELLGLSTALLAVGARAVIAPVVAVADQVTSALMDELHGHLAAGLGPAEAVARLAGPGRSRDLVPGSALAASLSFVCLGAG